MGVTFKTATKSMRLKHACGGNKVVVCANQTQTPLTHQIDEEAGAERASEHDRQHDNTSHPSRSAPPPPRDVTQTESRARASRRVRWVVGSSAAMFICTAISLRGWVHIL